MVKTLQCETFYTKCTGELLNGLFRKGAVSRRSSTLIASINHNPPYSYESPPGSLCFCGLSISLLETIARKMGKQLFLIPDRHADEYNTSYFGSPLDLESGVADISVCPLSSNPVRLLDFDMVQSYNTRDYQVAVHKSYVRLGVSDMLSGMEKTFDRDMWICILIISFITCSLVWCFGLVSSLVKKHIVLSRRSAFGALGTAIWEFISVSFRQAKIHYKTPFSCPLLAMFWQLWLLTCGAIVTAYFAASLSVSTSGLPFSSIKGFLESDFTLLSRSDYILQDQMYDRLKSRIIIDDANGSETVIVARAAAASPKSRYAVFCAFQDSTICSDRGFIPAFDLGKAAWVTVLQLRKNSSLYYHINARMLVLNQAGIIQHFLTIHRMMSGKNNGPAQSGKNTRQRRDIAVRALTLDRMGKLYISAGALLLASSGSFLFELLVQIHICDMSSAGGIFLR